MEFIAQENLIVHLLSSDRLVIDQSPGQTRGDESFVLGSNNSYPYQGRV
jgi:hypothetical protein